MSAANPISGIDYVLMASVLSIIAFFWLQ